ncbi:MAG: hypothetical protein ABR886_11400 [Dehalococcoidales bacterium]
MRVLFSLALILIGLVCAPVAFLSSITITSPISFVNGAHLSLWLGIFAIVIFINGVYLLIMDN